MSIEQPKKQAGAHMAMWFYGICPYCQRLLPVTQGIWPVHGWTAAEGALQCTMSSQPHQTSTS